MFNLRFIFHKIHWILFIIIFVFLVLFAHSSFSFLVTFSVNDEGELFFYYTNYLTPILTLLILLVAKRIRVPNRLIALSLVSLSVVLIFNTALGHLYEESCNWTLTLSIYEKVFLLFIDALNLMLVWFMIRKLNPKEQLLIGISVFITLIDLMFINASYSVLEFLHNLIL